MSPRQSSAIWNPLLSRSNCSSSFPFSLFVHQEGGLQARLLLNKAGRPCPAADSPPSERLTEGYCSRRLWAHSEVTHASNPVAGNGFTVLKPRARNSSPMSSLLFRQDRKSTRLNSSHLGI